MNCGKRRLMGRGRGESAPSALLGRNGGRDLGTQSEVSEVRQFLRTGTLCIEQNSPGC